jgi:hypothetical protein
MFKVHVRNAQGEMVPIPALASVRLVLGSSALIRYNCIAASPSTARPPRIQYRRRARRDGAAVGDNPAGRLRLRVDRHLTAGGGARQTTVSWRSRSCSHTCSWLNSSDCWLASMISPRITCASSATSRPPRSCSWYSKPSVLPSR